MCLQRFILRLHQDILFRIQFANDFQIALFAVERGGRFTRCAPENNFYSVPVREAVENNQLVKYSTFCSIPPRWVKYNLFFLEAAFEQAVTAPSSGHPQQPNLRWPQISLNTSTRSGCSSATAATESRAGKTRVSDHCGGGGVHWNEAHK